MYDFPVNLEPPFRPFFFFEPSEGPISDDGRVPTLLSTLFGRGQRIPDRAAVLAEQQAEIRRYEDYLAEADEPEFCGYYPNEFTEIGLVLPKDFKIGAQVSERLLLSFAYVNHPIGFEIAANPDEVRVQFAATEPDLGQLRQQLEAYFPGCHLDETGASGYDGRIAADWLNCEGSRVIVDFGLSEEFLLPLNAAQNFDSDPLIAMVGALSNLDRGETAVFQVLFQKAKNDWPKEIAETLYSFEGTGFFDYIPNLRHMVSRKLESSLFAVVVRAAAKSRHRSRSMEIVRNIGAGLAQLAVPPGNELIPLSNDGYDPEYQEQALLNRQSFRCGMLLNVAELVSIVHPPSERVRSPKLLREDQKTKEAPAIAIGNSLHLGENVHRGQASGVSLSADQRTRHIHVLGSTGSGKSTLLLNLIGQDLESGHGLCVIDPHGDLIDQVMALVPESRLKDVVLFDPSDSNYPIGFNFLQAKTELEKTVLSSDLVASFRRMSTSWGDVMDAVLANALLAFLESPKGGTLFELKRFLVEKGFREEFLDTVPDESTRYFWRHEFPLIANKPQASILIRLDTFLRQKLIRNIVCQKETKLDFRGIMDDRKVLLVKLSQGLIGEENSHLLGTLLVSKIYQTALTRQDSQNRPHFWLYMDEFQHFITPSMENILSGSRKYNLGLVLAHQEFRQLQSRSQDVASSILSNCYTRICFRLGDGDAEKLAGGFSFFDSKALQNLGVGYAIARIERAEFDFNLKITPASKPKGDNEALRQAIVDRTRARYAVLRDAVEAEHFIPQPVGAKAESSSEKRVAKREDDDDRLRFPAISTSSEKDAATKKDRTKASASGKVAPRTTDLEPVSETINAGQTQNTQQHRYLQSLIKRMAESKGFLVTIEKPVLGGLGKVDLVLESDAIKIACEISVTNEPGYEVNNLRKCLSAGFDRIVMIAPDGKHLSRVRRAAETDLFAADLAMIEFLTPEDVPVWLDGQADTTPTKESKVKGFKVNLKVNPDKEGHGPTHKRTISQVILGAFKRLKDTKRD